MRLWSNERGDTLVEVTLALAILAAVLMGAFMAANAAFRMGQTAKERSELVAAAQRQAEALTNFRDSHSWNEFLNGGGLGPSAYSGITIGAATNCTPGGTGCFHMERRQLNGIWQWVPVAGALTAVGDPTLPATSQLSIDPILVSANTYRFDVYYTNTVLGTSTAVNSGTVAMQLVNLDALR